MLNLYENIVGSCERAPMDITWAQVCHDVMDSNKLNAIEKNKYHTDGKQEASWRFFKVFNFCIPRRQGLAPVDASSNGNYQEFAPSK